MYMGIDRENVDTARDHQHDADGLDSDPFELHEFIDHGLRIPLTYKIDIQPTIVRINPFKDVFYTATLLIRQAGRSDRAGDVSNGCIPDSLPGGKFPTKCLIGRVAIFIIGIL